jgi:CheY-like chemotaxis protein
MSYALVITDHKMPKITGLELIERMRAANMRQPVILISGTMPTEELSRKPGLRVDAMVGKPFDFAELKTVIEKILDANPGSQAERPSLALTQGNKKPSRHILVVDDERASRQLTIDLMTSSGYVAEGAHDGAAGWEALQTQHYDLVITDNHMPRMTGLEMIEKLNASRRPIPVIMATGNLPMDEFARRPSLKPKAALQKPFAVRELLDAVRNILGPDEGNEDHEETRHRESF